MAAHPPLVDLVSAEQDRDFLLRLGVDGADLQDLQPGSWAPTLWPCKSELIAVCLPLSAAKSIKAPGRGWYEGQVAQLPTAKNTKIAHRWINVRWTDPRVGGGRKTWIDACKVSWIPAFNFKLEDEGTGGSVDSLPSLWLKRAAGGCAVASSQAEQVFLRKWWTEARRGVVRIAVTPSLVAARLREYHEARQFMASRMTDTQLWKAINSGTRSIAELDMPPGFLSAIHQARQRGAKYISPFGVYVAPSEAVPGELGLHALLLFHPCEVVGSWEGDWLWETEKGLYRRSGDSSPARPLSKFPNSAAICKYGMKFQNVDTVDGKRVSVTAMLDSCRGAHDLLLNQVRDRNEPFGFMNEPPTGQLANCEVESRVNMLEDRDDENRYSLLIVAMVPVLPHQEILIHYGQRYDRTYAMGEKCPSLFASLSMQSPSNGDFGAIGSGQHTGEASTASTAMPLTPVSLVSTCSASSSSTVHVGSPQLQEPPPVRCSKRIQALAHKALEASASAGREAKRQKVSSETPTHLASELPAPGDAIYIHLGRGQGVWVPHRGWFEATVVSISVKTAMAVLRWSCDRVDHGHQTQVNLRSVRWLPCIASNVVAFQRPGLEGHGCSMAWLERAVAGVQPDCEELSSQVFFARWWAELRWGVVRFTVTPHEVIDRLQELEEVRRFVAVVADDQAFWDTLSDHSLDLAGVPPAVARAITAAWRRGARRFFAQGLFIAQSHLEPCRFGLHTLALLHPATCVGVFGSGLPQRRPRANPASRRWKSQALSDRGAGGAKSDAGDAGPLSFLAEPPAASAANCEVCPMPSAKAQTLLVTLLPVLPLGELLAAGEGSTPAAAGSGGTSQIFADLAVRAFAA